MGPSNKTKLTLEEVVKYPLPGTAAPTKFSFSPDGTLLTYLKSPEGGLSLQLFAYDVNSGEEFQLVTLETDIADEEELSLEEKLRRERLRLREIGVTSYQWGDKGQRILLPLQGDIYVQDGRDAALRKVAEGSGKPLMNPKLSPGEDGVAYVQDSEVYVVSADGGEPVQVTGGARGTGKTNGLAEYVAQEEMARYEGFWWSTDSQWIAFEEVDETHIPIYRIMHQGKDGVGESAQEDHRYPFAGEENAKVRLGVVHRTGGDVIWMDIFKDVDSYLARVSWLPDGRLTAQIVNREQSKLDLILLYPNSGQAEHILQESSDVWINLHDMFWPLEKNPQFVWASERTGYQHLYLYDLAGTLVRQLTDGDWMVTELVRVDEENRKVYFTATKDHPTERHLYVVGLDDGEMHKLTEAPGIHVTAVDKRGTHFVDLHHALDTPPHVILRTLPDGKAKADIFENNDSRVNQLSLRPPELVEVKNKEGILMYGMLYRPPEGKGPFPGIIKVYGGPHAQLVANSWLSTVDMRAQYYADQGYVVLKLDNRGSAARGLAFESPIKHQMGHIEVQDQVEGVNWLVGQGLVDADRVGMYGWSYGGYMTLMSMAQAPEVFKAGVSGAPVSSWDGYDTFYTERYMGTPQSNPDGYQASSALEKAKDIKGELLLVHGLIDENVHFRHTARMMNALIAAGKYFDLLVFPDERHMPRRPADLIYLEERIEDFFRKNL